MSHDHEPTTAAIAGLASEVEALRRKVQQLEAVPEKVRRLADLISRVADRVSGNTAQGEPEPVQSWLMSPRSAAGGERLLDELIAWLDAVFLRYEDGAEALPDCWLWHPDVIEELLWLMHAWSEAYQGESASIRAVADWHDRYRPGVVRRLRANAGTCSLEQHSPPIPPRTAPITEARQPLAAWWATSRDHAAPEPTDEHYAAAPRRHRGGFRR